MLPNSGRLAWAIFLCAGACRPAFATYSIVAVDSATKQVGGAGASCLENSAGAPGGVLVISDLLPGKGAIHTQAQHDATNKLHAHEQMVAGKSPVEIMDWLSKNDVAGTPGVRQYGAVDLFQGSPRASAFTGVDCMDYKGHRTGRNYALQGNILLGAAVLDSMESRFIKTPGTLADKLMAALQGAKRPGADTRCLAEGVSAQSAFIRVAKPGDAVTKFYLDLRVPSRPRGKEPVDSLQKLYDSWKATTTAPGLAVPGLAAMRIFRLGDELRLEPGLGSGQSILDVTLYSVAGVKLHHARPTPRGAAAAVFLPESFRSGLYLLEIRGSGFALSRKVFWP